MAVKFVLVDRFRKLSQRRRYLIGAVLLYIVLILGAASLAAWQSQRLITQIKHGEYLLASATANTTSTALNTLKWLTLGIVPDIAFAQKATTLLATNRPLLFWLSQLQTEPFQPTESPLPFKSVETFSNQLTNLTNQCAKTWFIASFKNGGICNLLTTANQLTHDLLPTLENHLDQNHTYIVLFQNSEELRASGGFMGSFARVTVGAQGISELTIQDIYEPDGQFQGFVPAPPGVAEYLSSGNGLRLPDANWAAHFPTAAQTILSYFSLGKEQDIDGIIAINSSLIEKLLAITGDIYLPDYQTNISATTFTTLARADRDSFFPGSKQKQHFLTSFMTQLKIRLSELSPSQRQALAELVTTSIASKDILAFSTNPNFQTFLSSHHVTGELIQPNTTDLLYLLESNVGINKANKGVTRQVAINRENYRQTTTITFTNENPTSPPPTSADKNLDYFNYQRLIVPTSWQVESISNARDTINDNRGSTNQNQAPTTWSEQIITNDYGHQFKQIGYLVSVPAGSSASTSISFKTPAVVDAVIDSTPTSTHTITPYSLTLIKQPGLAATPYTITWQDQNQTILLDQDTQLQFKL